MIDLIYNCFSNAIMSCVSIETRALFILYILIRQAMNTIFTSVISGAVVADALLDDNIFAAK